MSDIMDKLAILGDAAKFDASCSSSGGGRAGKPGQLGNAHSAGICHAWAQDGRCISLLKVLQSNACVYNCAYCMNRRENDTPRATFVPEELADLTVQFYRRNYIEGLFLSSGIVKNADHTMEQMIETMRLLREKHRFGGYIHVKTIPGSDPMLIEKAGLLADRISVNIELPSSESLGLLAPQKKPEQIFTPMHLIKNAQSLYLEDKRKFHHAPMFAPAGQTTQMIVGASPDDDRTIVKLTQGLYRKYKMKRVYFSAYVSVGSDSSLPPQGTPAPLLREHRLYQADWLLRFYHFDADEIMEQPELDLELDPKCAWALRHPEFFPVEVNSAPIERLLRVPGLGVVSAQRIMRARRLGAIQAHELRNFGIVMKRARFFITANGKYVGAARHDQPFVREYLTDKTGMGQLSMFGDSSQRQLPAAVTVS